MVLEKNEKKKESYLYCTCDCPFCLETINCSVNQKTLAGIVGYPRCSCGASYGISFFDGDMLLFNTMLNEVRSKNNSDGALWEEVKCRNVVQGGRKVAIVCLFIFMKAKKEKKSNLSRDNTQDTFQ
jgi:hypothetical protein